MPKIMTGKGREGGFMLATVLVFLVVLSVTVFFAAGLTRTDIQTVTNERNEKEAFTAAEAGIDEALYRLSLAGGDTAAITGINSGNNFEASLAPTVPGRDTTNGASDFGIVNTNTASTSQILFVTATSTSGANNLVPTLQPPATTRSLYSTASADTTPVDMDATTNLTIGWDLCTAAQVSAGAAGCGGGAGTIRQLPTSNPRPVVKIVSTGQSGSARRKITVRAVDCVPNSGVGNGSIVTLGTACNAGIGLNGGSTVTAAGTIAINAGAASNTPSQCQAASTGGSTSSITALAIDVVGGVSGTFNPSATTGVLPTSDPYATLAPPSFSGAAIQCGSASAPSQCQYGNNAVLNPGIYYGGILITGTNVTLSAGTYIIAGGGFQVSNGTTSVTSASGGVLIYNTQDPAHPNGSGAAGAFNLSNGNTTANLAAPTTGAFAGVVLYQDRTLSPPQPAISISGGNSGRVLDGLVYAPGATFNVKGGTNSSTTVGGSLIVNNITVQGNGSLAVQDGSRLPPPPLCTQFAYLPISWQDF